VCESEQARQENSARPRETRDAPAR
jgi:hypothetical protein